MKKHLTKEPKKLFIVNYKGEASNNSKPFEFKEVIFVRKQSADEFIKKTEHLYHMEVQEVETYE